MAERTQVKPTPKRREALPQAQRKPKGKSNTAVQDADDFLEEIDALLDEVAGGSATEYAQAFVAGYQQKGGQ